jgi:hypothetical protein
LILNNFQSSSSSLACRAIASSRRRIVVLVLNYQEQKQPQTVQQRMKTKLLFATLAILAIVFASTIVVTIHARQGAPGSPLTRVTTNWIGYVVIGESSSIDGMPGTTKPLPKAITHLELGLRSDGVVVWRSARPAQGNQF